jgi:hypothetical protein
MTGCQFARLIAQKRERVVAAAFSDLAPEADVSRLFETDTGLTALQLTPAKYRSLTRASKGASEQLLAELDDDARYYRLAAFRLQPVVAELLGPDFLLALGSS